MQSMKRPNIFEHLAKHSIAITFRDSQNYHRFTYSLANQDERYLKKFKVNDRKMHDSPCSNRNLLTPKHSTPHGASQVTT